MSRSFHLLGLTAALAATNLGGFGAPPHAAPTPTTKLTAIIVRGVDRSGVTRRLKGSFAPVAVQFFRDGFEAPYYADSNGVLHIQRGSYLIGVDIPTFGPGGAQVSDTLAARAVRIGSSGGTRTLTVDAKLGRPVRVSFSLPGARREFVGASLCASSSAYKGQFGIDLVASGNLAGLYAIPAHASNLRLLMSSVWQGADGTQYGLGVSASGIPGHPDYSFAPSRLATLRFRVASGATAGRSGLLNTNFAAPCPVGGPSIGGMVTMPGVATEHVSAGRWATQFTINGPGDDARGMVQNVIAGHAYTATFGGAVYGPGTAALPRYFAARRPGYLMVSLDNFFEDPTANLSTSASEGILRLAGPHVVKTDRFKLGGQFTTTLRRPGSYTISVTARPLPPPAGVSPAILSTKVTLTWRFVASASDLADSLSPAPVSVTTFEPRGLNLSNQAALSSVTPIRLVIQRGEPYPGHRIKAVRLEISRDGGLSWHSVRVTAKAGGWLAEVDNPFRCFVSLRSIVTDVKGDRTVETIYRAYEVT